MFGHPFEHLMVDVYKRQAQIKDIILKESDVPVQNISIVEVNQ